MGTMNMALPAWDAMTEDQAGRWAELLAGVAAMLPAEVSYVLVDGGPHAAAVADRLADRVRATGRACVRAHPVPAPPASAPGAPGAVLTVADDSGPAHAAAGGWDVVIRLRLGRGGGQDAERGADLVVDLHDVLWPVIRHVTPRPAGGGDRPGRTAVRSVPVRTARGRRRPDRTRRGTGDRRHRGPAARTRRAAARAWRVRPSGRGVPAGGERPHRVRRRGRPAPARGLP